MRKIVAHKKSFTHLFYLRSRCMLLAHLNRFSIQFKYKSRASTTFLYKRLVVTNFMHLHCTYTPHLQYLQSRTHLESNRTSVVEDFCRNSQHVEAVGYFRRRALLWMFHRMFDRILNASMPNNLL